MIPAAAAGWAVAIGHSPAQAQPLPERARGMGQLVAALNRCGTGLSVTATPDALRARMQPEQWRNFRLLALRDMALAQKVFGPLIVHFLPNGQLSIDNLADYGAANTSAVLDCASYRGLKEALDAGDPAQVQSALQRAPAATSPLPPATAPLASAAPSALPAPAPQTPTVSVPATPPPTAASAPPAPDERTIRSLNHLSRLGLAFNRVDGRLKRFVEHTLGRSGVAPRP